MIDKINSKLFKIMVLNQFIKLDENLYLLKLNDTLVQSEFSTIDEEDFGLLKMSFLYRSGILVGIIFKTMVKPTKVGRNYLAIKRPNEKDFKNVKQKFKNEHVIIIEAENKALLVCLNSKMIIQ
jgi:hypothetical protein